MEVSQFLMRQMKWSRGISVVEIHGASLWCEGPSNEMRSRGFTGVWWGGLACFHFRLTDFGFFFPQCSRITNCFVTRMWFSVFFLLLDFWNKSFWNVFFKVKLMTVLDIFQTNVFVFPLFFYFVIWIFVWLDLDFILWLFWFFVCEFVQLDFVSKGYVFACNFIIMWILCFDFWSVIVDV